MIWFANTRYDWVYCCLSCFIPTNRPFFKYWFWLRIATFTWSRYINVGLAESVTDQRGMLTPPGHLIQPAVCPDAHVFSSLNLYFYGIYSVFFIAVITLIIVILTFSLIIVPCLCLFIIKYIFNCSLSQISLLVHY